MAVFVIVFEKFHFLPVLSREKTKVLIRFETAEDFKDCEGKGNGGWGNDDTMVSAGVLAPAGISLLPQLRKISLIIADLVVRLVVQTLKQNLILPPFLKKNPWGTVASPSGP